MGKTALVKMKDSNAVKAPAGMRQMAAGEFKARCLAIMDEVNQTGKPLLVTKRGKPSIKIFPAAKGDGRNHSIIGRLEGVMKINGDPNDLVKPIFPLEDWDMLK